MGERGGWWLRRTALAMAVLAGCDAGPEPARPARDAAVTDSQPIDAATDAATDASAVCDPLAPAGQAGCPVGHKCTWVTLADGATPLGVLGCMPAGPVHVNGVCTSGPPGVTTGFDDCVDGAVCVAGTCADICGFGGGANDACAVGLSCVRHAGLFANGADDPLAGACQPNCDPLTQTPCGPGQGCYVVASATTTIAVCAGAGVLGHGERIVGQVFINSCLPGMQARRGSGPGELECGALCRPANVYMGMNEAHEGGIAPATCAARGAAPPDDAAAGESCRYWWAREPFVEPSPFSNTLGWCFRHTAFQYDSNGDQAVDAPFPRCVALTTGDVVPPIGDPPHNDAAYFWCVTLSALFARPVPDPTTTDPAEPRPDRLAPAPRAGR